MKLQSRTRLPGGWFREVWFDKSGKARVKLVPPKKKK